MARYRQKDDVDLRWNAIRRAITMKVDLEVRTWRDRRLNDELSAAWQQFAAALGKGEILELDPIAEGWIKDALDAVPLGHEAQAG